MAPQGACHAQGRSLAWQRSSLAAAIVCGCDTSKSARNPADNGSREVGKVSIQVSNARPTPAKKPRRWTAVRPPEAPAAVASKPEPPVEVRSAQPQTQHSAAPKDEPAPARSTTLSANKPQPLRKPQRKPAQKPVVVSAAEPRAPAESPAPPLRAAPAPVRRVPFKKPPPQASISTKDAVSASRCRGPRLGST